MEYQVNFGFHAFSVPSAVVDNLIRLAKENHLKVLLYLLRYPDKQFTVSQIASFLRMPQEQAEEALAFWSQVNILEDKTEEKQLELFPAFFASPAPASPEPKPTPEPVPAPASAPAPEPEKPAPSAPAPAPVQKKKTEVELFRFFTHDSIYEMIAASPELEQLLRIAEEKYYHRPLNTVQMDSIVWMHEYLEMPSEVIQILLQYCTDIEKLSPNYINKMAAGWYEDEILTPELARQKTEELLEYYTYKNYICRLFEVSATTEAQREYIKIWQQWEFSEELLRYARDLSVEATAKVNFKYIDSILTEWHETHVTELEEAKKKHDEYIKKYKEKSKRGRKKKNSEEMTEKEIQKMNEYMSVVNQFHFEEGDTSS